MNEMILAKKISMRFNLEEEKTDTLKEYFLKMVKHQLHFKEFWALSDINISILRGESVALLGPNGSGKSTLLKVISGIMRPTTGIIKVNGTIAPLIELGAGFDVEMTARENIFLNGALLGRTKKEMQKEFDGIIEFAELQDFIDVPLKNYSSGMMARLGFSVATCTRADILVVDEILAVGDYSFQQKCQQRMKKMMDNGTTLLFVTHDTDKVKELCERAIWLEHGRLREDGPAVSVCDHYISEMNK